MTEILKPSLGLWKRKPELLTQLLSKLKNPDLISQILDAIWQAGGRVTSSHLIVAIQSHRDEAQWEEALQLFTEASRKYSLSPDVVSGALAISACGKSSRWILAVELLGQFPELRISPDVRLLNGFMSTLDRWELALSIFGSMAQMRISPDVYAYNIMLRALGNSGQWQLAIDLFDRISEQALLPSIVTGNTVIGAVARHSKWDLTVELLKNLANKSLVPDIISFQSVIQAVANADEWGQALTILADMKTDWAFQLGPQEVTFALTACSQTHQWQQALQLLGLLRDGPFERDLPARNVAIRACGQAKQWQRALDLFYELGEVDEVMTRSVVAACVGDWQQTLLLLASLPASSVTVLTYTPAIQACGEMSEWTWAIKLFADVKKAEVKPDVVLYTAVMKACSFDWDLILDGATDDPWQEAFVLLAQLLDVKLSPDSLAYAAAISACKRGGHWEQALKVFSQMQEASVQAVSKAYVAAMSACRQEWPKAIDLMAEWEKSNSQDLIVRNAAMSALAQGEEWQQALGLLSDLDVEIDIVTRNACLSACEKASQWRWALALFDENVKEGLQLSIISYNLMISTLAKAEHWESALEFLSELQARTLESNVITHAVTMNALGRGSQWEEALHQLFDPQKPPVTYITMGPILNALQTCSLWTDALSLFRSMAIGKLQPSVACYDYALLACLAAGERDQASELLQESIHLREAVSLLWGLAMVSSSDPIQIHAACVGAFKAAGDTKSLLSPEALARTLWSVSMLGANNQRFRQKLLDQATHVFFFN